MKNYKLFKPKGFGVVNDIDDYVEFYETSEDALFNILNSYHKEKENNHCFSFFKCDSEDKWKLSIDVVGESSGYQINYRCFNCSNITCSLEDLSGIQSMVMDGF